MLARVTIGFVLALAIVGVDHATALDVEIALRCPANVRAGGLLSVPLVIRNEEIREVSFDRKLVALVGNTDDSLSGIGVFGPFVRTGRGLETVVAGTPTQVCRFGSAAGSPCTTPAEQNACSTGGGFCGPGVAPGLLDTGVVVVSQVPLALQGRAADVIVSIDFDDGVETDSASDQCAIGVLRPAP